MQKYQDSVLDKNGRPVSGATVAVTTSAGAAATIYSDNGSTVLDSLTTGTDGSFAFYAADGRYNIQITKQGFTTRTISDVLLEDPAEEVLEIAALQGSVSALESGKASLAQLAASGGSALVGHFGGRSAYLKLRELDSLADFGAVPNVSADQTLKIQEALNEYAAANPASGKMRAPPGKWNFEGQIIMPGHIGFVGHSSDSYGAGQPGSELAFQGVGVLSAGQAAIITATSDNEDWSRGYIENLRIRNYGAVSNGLGLGVRNPQNGSWVRSVVVDRFPERQIKVYEPSTRAAGAGTCPGYFFMDNIFAMGGVTPLEVQAGVEQIVVSNFGVDTDATSTKGILVTKSAAGQPQRAPIKFIGGKVEIQQVSADVNGVEWDQDLAIDFDTVAVQRNDNITSTKSAFHYSGTSRNIPTASFRNCSTWNLANKFKLNAAGITAAVGAINSPESFGWSRDLADTVFVFGRESLTAGLTSQSLHTGANANFGGIGFLVTRPCYIAGIAGTSTAAITTDTITLSILKNGATFVTSLALNSANQRRYTDFTSGTQINSSNFQLAPGDRVSMQITTGASFAPTGGHCVAELFLRPL